MNGYITIGRFASTLVPYHSQMEKFHGLIYAIISCTASAFADRYLPVQHTILVTLIDFRRVWSFVSQLELFSGRKACSTFSNFGKLLLIGDFCWRRNSFKDLWFLGEEVNCKSSSGALLSAFFKVIVNFIWPFWHFYR